MTTRYQTIFMQASFVILSLIYNINIAYAATATFPTLPSLGASLFSDTSLSLNRTQSCATCHNPNHGFIDIRGTVGGAVSLGDNGFSLGNRNTPTASYASFSPNFTAAETGSRGGQFWDGRAGDLRVQAEGPFLNPVEMGMPSKAAVLARVQENASYVEAFKSFFGDSIFDNDDTAYSSLAESIAQFERTATFAPFDSKFDRSIAGTYAMTTSEQRGRMLFFSPMTNCSNSHVTAGVGANSSSQMFTDYTYFNIGTPSNSLLNATLTSLGQHVALTTAGDQGLLGNSAIGGAATQGLFKTPTLRNVAITAPYMHNGAFGSLKTVLDFYDHQGGNPLRAINPDTGAPWAAPETAATVSSGRLGMRDLSDQNINDLECFLRILTDQKFEVALPALRAGLSCS